MIFKLFKRKSKIDHKKIELQQNNALKIQAVTTSIIKTLNDNINIIKKYKCDLNGFNDIQVDAYYVNEFNDIKACIYIHSSNKNNQYTLIPNNINDIRSAATMIVNKLNNHSNVPIYIIAHSNNVELDTIKITFNSLNMFNDTNRFDMDVLIKNYSYILKWDEIKRIVGLKLDNNIKRNGKLDNNIKRNGNPYYTILTHITHNINIPNLINFDYQYDRANIKLSSNMDICNSRSYVTNKWFELYISVEDSIEYITESIKTINSYIDQLVKAEQELLKHNLHSIVALRDIDNNENVIYVSNTDDMVLDDVKFEYTDLFTGLRQTIMLNSIKAISQDNMKPKATTLLPNIHKDVFNQHLIGVNND